MILFIRLENIKGRIIRSFVLTNEEEEEEDFLLSSIDGNVSSSSGKQKIVRS